MPTYEQTLASGTEFDGTNGKGLLTFDGLVESTKPHRVIVHSYGWIVRNAAGTMDMDVTIVGDDDDGGGDGDADWGILEDTAGLRSKVVSDLHLALPIADDGESCHLKFVSANSTAHERVVWCEYSVDLPSKR